MDRAIFLEGGAQFGHVFCGRIRPYGLVCIDGHSRAIGLEDIDGQYFAVKKPLLLCLVGQLV